MLGKARQRARLQNNDCSTFDAGVLDVGFPVESDDMVLSLAISYLLYVLSASRDSTRVQCLGKLGFKRRIAFAWCAAVLSPARSIIF